MTHGFDDEGAQFDGYGNLKNWWAPEDLARFHAATTCIAQQFSAYTVASGMHVQGDLVTGEASADLGGLVLAWQALPATPAASGRPPPAGEFTPDQQFFIAFAHSWASSTRAKQAQNSVTTDPHPPADDRTNGSLANIPAFQAAFGLSAKGPMVKTHRCVIW
jgi:putative endopeptidase